MEDERFGFTVSKRTWTYGPEVERIEENGNKIYAKRLLDPPEWSVYLPHQCDDWRIAGGYGEASQAEVIADLERFIAEAQQALAALREGRELAPQ